MVMRFCETVARENVAESGRKLDFETDPLFREKQLLVQLDSHGEMRYLPDTPPRFTP